MKEVKRLEREKDSRKKEAEGTKEKLLESAKEEFMEKGYEKSSLRKICAKAGVTTGALYFFFQDKEDLFASIVEEPFFKLQEILIAHFREEEEILNSSQDFHSQFFHLEQENNMHRDLLVELVHIFYRNYDSFMLLLTKAQGSRFENSVDVMVEITEKNYQLMASHMAKKYPGKKINEYMCHWLTHMCIDAFLHLFMHEKDEEKALQYIQAIMNYIVRGWTELVLE